GGRSRGPGQAAQAADGRPLHPGRRHPRLSHRGRLRTRVRPPRPGRGATPARHQAAPRAQGADPHRRGFRPARALRGAPGRHQHAGHPRDLARPGHLVAARPCRHARLAPGAACDPRRAGHCPPHRGGPVHGCRWRPGVHQRQHQRPPTGADPPTGALGPRFPGGPGPGRSLRDASPPVQDPRRTHRRGHPRL
ncbi:MAG: Threonylcarbamoyl-AMP synthase (EC 2.7.7.87), partial [Olavius algarvensis Gamma 1 endosymbiont]